MSKIIRLPVTERILIDVRPGMFQLDTGESLWSAVKCLLAAAVVGAILWAGIVLAFLAWED